MVETFRVNKVICMVMYDVVFVCIFSQHIIYMCILQRIWKLCIFLIDMIFSEDNKMLNAIGQQSHCLMFT